MSTRMKTLRSRSGRNVLTTTSARRAVRAPVDRPTSSPDDVFAQGVELAARAPEIDRRPAVDLPQAGRARWAGACASGTRAGRAGCHARDDRPLPTRASRSGPSSRTSSRRPRGGPLAGSDEAAWRIACVSSGAKAEGGADWPGSRAEGSHASRTAPRTPCRVRFATASDDVVRSVSRTDRGTVVLTATIVERERAPRRATRAR